MMNAVFLAYTFALFVVPMLTIVGLYAAIGLTLRRRARVEMASALLATLGGGRDNHGRTTGIEMTPMTGCRRRRVIGHLGCSAGQQRGPSAPSVYISGRQAVLKVLGLLTFAVTKSHSSQSLCAFLRSVGSHILHVHYSCSNSHGSRVVHC